MLRAFAMTALILDTLLAPTFRTGQRTGRAVPAATRNMERAVAAYTAMQTYFYQRDGSRLYLEQYPRAADDRPYSYEWPFSQAFAATIDLLALPGRAGLRYRDDVRDRARGQERYWDTTGTTGLPGYDAYPHPPYGHGDDLFYDDNEWVALQQIRLYRLTGDQGALDRAKEIFRLVVSGWDTDPSHPAPGGVFWTQEPSNHDRNTVSTMPAAALGLRLYQITADRYYLDWARRMYEWTNKYLLAPNGLYWDRINLAGTIEKTQWSYNQGVPVGVNALFYQVTGNATYLRRAEATARTALDFYGAGDRLYGQPAFFNAIFFKNLLLLQSVTHDPLYARATQAYADRVWTDYRDRRTDLFRFDPAKPTTLLDQAAMIQIYTILAWDPSDYTDAF